MGVDIDHCYDKEKGEFNDVARAVMAKQPTYMEFSPSGTGIHLLFKGTKPEGACKNSANGIEMYDGGRYFTVTGRKLDGAPDEIAEDNGILSLPAEISPSDPMSIDGPCFQPCWENVFEYPPRYYYDETTGNLFLDGYWGDVLIHDKGGIVIGGKTRLYSSRI